MHGLINRSIQCFLRDVYGAQTWRDVAGSAELGLTDFEAMWIYEDALTERMLDAAAALLTKPRSALLTDLGTYLVSHPNTEALRRLLRFGGPDYVEFLHSLDALPGRARMAVPDLKLPALELTEEGEGSFTLACAPGLPGYGHVMCGLLQGMADDYGVLVFIDPEGEDAARIAITVHDAAFAQDRGFQMTLGPG